MRVLFLSARHPSPPTTGDKLRVHHLLRGLAGRADVTLICFDAPAEPLPGVRVESVARRLPRTALENLRVPAPGVPLQVRLYLDAAMRRLVEHEIRAWRPDVVHASLIRMAPYLPAPGTCHRHLDLIDSLALNMRTRAAASSPLARAALNAEARLLARYERAAAQAADTCSVVSAADREAGLLEAEVIPMGVDTDGLPFVDPADRPPTLLFFGNLGYFHNVEPARHVATRILPLVRAALPDVRLRIVGARPARAVCELDRLDGVTVVGPVPDIAAELHGAAVAVVPMFTGSGMKCKVIEAFAAGTPVVTNARGTEGLEDVEPGVHCLVAEPPEAIAEACVRLLGAPRARSALAAAAHGLVTSRYTWDAAVSALLDLYGADAAPALARAA